MKYSKTVEKAIKKSAVIHQSQLRKSPEVIPYITHPFGVAVLLSEYTNDEDLIVAALLHDTIEDSEYTPEQLEKDFGQRVKEIVMGVTEQKTDDSGEERPWRIRKEDYIKNLENDSQEALLLSAADKICNMRTQLDDFDNSDHTFLEKFKSTPEERYWYNESVLNVLKRRLKKQEILKEFESLLKQTIKMQK